MRGKSLPSEKQFFCAKSAHDATPRKPIRQAQGKQRSFFMPAILAERGISRQSLQTRMFTTGDVVRQSFDTGRIREGMRRPEKGAGTAAWIQYFDVAENRIKEELPTEWYNLKSKSDKQVGFMMQRQMDALKNPSDADAVVDWARKTRRDLQGFKLEFLSDHNVYPRKYQIVRSSDPTHSVRLEDPMYGKSKDPRYQFSDIEEVVSEEERNGSVKRAMGEIKMFMADAPIGSMTVLTSPLGPSGLKTDEGVEIDYPDTYFFVKVKTSPTEVINYTIKTDFTLQEARAVIARLTGVTLTKEDPLEAYAYALAKIKPGDKEGINTVFDVVDLLEQVYPAAPFIDTQNGKVNTWKDVRDDIVQGERLYDFDKATTIIIDEFTAYAEEGHTKEELQKAIAVAILRMGEQFFTRQEFSKKPKAILMKPGIWIAPGVIPGYRFGDTLEKTAARPGCAGGGDKKTKAVDTGGGIRLGLVEKDKYGSREFNCPDCGQKNVRPENDRLTECQHCSSKAVAC